MKVRLEFKPQDMWVGLFWRTEGHREAMWIYSTTEIWVCILPMLPIHITVNSKEWS